MRKSSTEDELGNSFARIKKSYDAKKTRDPALVCRHGLYVDCHVLKLQKDVWTNDSMQAVPNKSGVFFSIWLHVDASKQNRARYNIHALKLRQLRGYKVTSRDFAEEFRQRFAGIQHHWPNVSVDFGPLTLMEGWFDFVPKTFEQDVLKLMNRFQEIGPVIDELLAKRRVVGK